MELKNFVAALTSASERHVSFVLPGNEKIAPHFHVTEIGKVTKDFVDCGGTRRTTEACVLQTLVADDTDHRLTASKLAGIVDKAAVLGLANEIEVEVEVQRETIGIYAIQSVIESESTVIFALAAKRTACLAPDLCGIDGLNVLGSDCGGEPGCC